MEKTYILFQFECVMNHVEQFEEERAIKFKYNPSAVDIDEEIRKYADYLRDDFIDKTWDKIKPDLNKMTVKEIDELLKNFYLGCYFFYEVISKEEYQEWKELNKSGKIIFV